MLVDGGGFDINPEINDFIVFVIFEHAAGDNEVTNASGSLSLLSSLSEPLLGISSRKS